MVRSGCPPEVLSGDPLLARMAGDRNTLQATVLAPLLQSIRNLGDLRDEIDAQIPSRIA